MDLPVNLLKHALRDGRPQIGLWSGLSSHIAVEVVRDAGFEICVIVQIETREALRNLEAMAAVDGVDGLFIGPSDLSADMGHLGDNAHPDVRQAIEDAIRRVGRTGKAAGILAPIEADARHWLEIGCLFVAVGSDVGILARQSEALAAKFKGAMSR